MSLNRRYRIYPVVFIAATVLTLNLKGGIFMKPIYITVLPEETGRHIRELMDDKNLKVRDIQVACGFEQPQAIYKWLSGKSLPSLDNMAILARVLCTTIDSILVIGGDADFFSEYLYHKKTVAKIIFI